MAYDLNRFSGTGPDRTLSLPIDDQADDHEVTVDRLGIHMVLEVLLLVGFAAALFLFYRADAAPLSTDVGRQIVTVATVPLLLSAIAASLALRVGTVNLAGGAVAVAAAVLFSEYAGQGLAVAVAMAVAGALAGAVILVILVVVLRVPAWLSGLAVAAGTALWMSEHVDLSTLSSGPITPLPARQAWIWLIAVAALSILGGIVGALSGWRARLGACRAAAAGTEPRDGATIATTITALAGSCLLSGLAGVWLVWAPPPEPNPGYPGLDLWTLTGFGLAAALLGGTSLLGRRGGVLGTLLAALGLASLVFLSTIDGWPISVGWILLGAIGCGVIISRLVEAFGRPDPRWNDDETAPAVDTAGYHAAMDRGDADHRAADIDPYRGSTRTDEYRYG